MNYSELSQGKIFSCKVKATYTEIFVLTQNQYIKVFSVQKKDYPDVLGLGEKIEVERGLAPITLTDETIKFILSKHYGLGAISTNIADNTVIKDMNAQQMQQNSQFEAFEPTVVNPPVVKEEGPNEIDPILLLTIAPVVYVNVSAIECELVEEEDVEIEDVPDEDPVVQLEEQIKEEIKEEKDYSKFIWLALGAAALLL